MQPTVNPLTGRHGFVTGAARGIGRAIAIHLGELGADLTLSAREISSLEMTLGDLRAFDIDVACVELDLTRPETLASAITANGKSIDILVNNAGVAPSAPVEKIAPETWRETFEINVAAPFMAAQAAVPGMKQRNWGRIINVASTAGLIGYPFTAAYVSSKHAVVGLTRALAKELASTGITVNAVCPGFTDTDIAKGAIQNIMAGGKTAEVAEKILARGNPQGRLIQPREVAEAVGWLCLEGSAAINGQALPVDGGEVIS